MNRNTMKLEYIFAFNTWMWRCIMARMELFPLWLYKKKYFELLVEIYKRNQGKVSLWCVSGAVREQGPDYLQWGWEVLIDYGLLFLSRSVKSVALLLCSNLLWLISSAVYRCRQGRRVSHSANALSRLGAWRKSRRSHPPARSPPPPTSSWFLPL